MRVAGNAVASAKPRVPEGRERAGGLQAFNIARLSGGFCVMQFGRIVVAGGHVLRGNLQLHQEPNTFVFTLPACRVLQCFAPLATLFWFALVRVGKIVDEESGEKEGGLRCMNSDGGRGRCTPARVVGTPGPACFRVWLEGSRGRDPAAFVPRWAGTAGKVPHACFPHLCYTVCIFGGLGGQQVWSGCGMSLGCSAAETASIAATLANTLSTDMASLGVACPCHGIIGGIVHVMDME